MKAKNPEFIYICDPQQSVRGPLQGIRLGVKDLFHVAGLPTTAGNPDWLASHPIPEVTAPSVTALLQVGATLIGKTLTDELAYSLDGINQHYGAPLNHQAPLRFPGGSSSGSAVAVANDSIDIGLGSDTGGSIRVPASYNGIYGFRPSHGIVSCEHLVPLSPRFDTVGWLARDLRTIIQVAEVLMPTLKSSLEFARPNQAQEKQLSQLVVANIADLNIWQTNRQPLLDAWSDRFKSVHFVELTEDFLASASETLRILQGREIWRTHGEWIERQQPNFAPEISDRFNWCRSLSSHDELQAEKARQKFIDFWQTNVLPSQNHLLLMPTTPGAAPLLRTPPAELRAYRTRLMGFTALSALTRAPQISLPYLIDQQAPWGVSLLGHYDGDRALLKCAARIENLAS